MHIAVGAQAFAIEWPIVICIFVRVSRSIYVCKLDAVHNSWGPQILILHALLITGVDVRVQGEGLRREREKARLLIKYLVCICGWLTPPSPVSSPLPSPSHHYSTMSTNTNTQLARSSDRNRDSISAPPLPPRSHAHPPRVAARP